MSVLVIVPVASHIEAPCELALQILERAGHTVWRRWGHSDIARGRSALATEALAQGFDEIMWIDSDIAFDPADVERLRSHGRPIVGGIYPVKGMRRLACQLLPGTKSVAFGKGGGLFEVRAAPAGFLYTKREVYERIRAHHELPCCDDAEGAGVVPFFLSLVVPDERTPGKHRYLSEDFSFCERARACGYEILMDSTIRLGHVGAYTYSWEDAGKALERHASFKLVLNEP
ncbi:MAG TPA: hypothetical protein VIF62_02085 [Labilithrix sp.]